MNERQTLSGDRSQSHRVSLREDVLVAFIFGSLRGACDVTEIWMGEYSTTSPMTLYRACLPINMLTKSPKSRHF